MTPLRASLARWLDHCDLVILAAQGRLVFVEDDAKSFETKVDGFVLPSSASYLKIEVRDCFPTDPRCCDTSRVADGLPLTGRHTRALKGGQP